MRTTLSLLVFLVVLAACPARSPEQGASPASSGDAEAARLVLPFIPDDYAGALAQAQERDLPLFIETWAPW